MLQVQLALGVWSFTAGVVLAAAVALAGRLCRPPGRHTGRRRDHQPDPPVEQGILRHDGTGRTHHRSVSATDRTARAAIAADYLRRPVPNSHILAGRDERASRWRVGNLLDDTRDITPVELAQLLAAGRRLAQAR